MMVFRLLFLSLFLLITEEKLISKFVPRMVETDDDPRTTEYMVKLPHENAHLVLVKKHLEGYKPSLSINMKEVPLGFDYANCIYDGHVNGKPGSKLYLTTCQGINGLIDNGESVYQISPDPDINHYDFTDKSRHIIFKSNASFEDMKCGVDHEEVFNISDRLPKYIPLPGLKFLNKEPDLRSRYLKLSFVIDCGSLDYYEFGSNITRIIQYCFEGVNQMRFYFNFANLTAVLMHIDIRTNFSLCYPYSYQMTNRDHAEYMVLHRIQLAKIGKQYDITVTLSKHAVGGVVGLAYLHSVCRGNGGIFVYIGSLYSYGLILGHEIGHTFGCGHGHSRSNCITKSGYGSIMKSGYGWQPYIYYTFEDCDQEIIMGKSMEGGSCIYNNLTEVPFFNSYCGNGIIELDEECDCGGVINCFKSGLDSCCNPNNCLLNPNHYCAKNSECCENCRERQEQTICYKNEICKSGFCDHANKKCNLEMDLSFPTNCKNNGLCLNGRCIQLENECQNIFGPLSKIADNTCYTEINSRGDKFGSCGHDPKNYTKYIKCSTDDIKCGNLICSYHGVILNKDVEIYVHNNRCASILENSHFSANSYKYRTDLSFCRNQQFVCSLGKCTNVTQLNIQIYPDTCARFAALNQQGKCACMKKLAMIDRECLPFTFEKEVKTQTGIYATLIALNILKLLIPFLCLHKLWFYRIKEYSFKLKKKVGI